MTPWVGWERIAVPKGLGGWGPNNIYCLQRLLRPKEDGDLLTRKLFGRMPLFTSIWLRNQLKTGLGIPGNPMWGVQSFGKQWWNLSISLEPTLHGMWGMEYGFRMGRIIGLDAPSNIYFMLKRWLPFVRGILYIFINLLILARGIFGSSLWGRTQILGWLNRMKGRWLDILVKWTRHLYC